MSLTQSLRHSGLSLLIVGMLCGACDDGDDPGTSADEQTQSDAGAKTDTRTARAGAAAAGRGGNAARTSNNSAAGSAGRSTSNTGSAGQAGRATPAANGGSGGAAGATQAGSGGAAGSVDPSRMSLSDGQIVAVLAAVNSSEISHGTTAMTRAVGDGVRNFADSMVTVHNTAQARQNDLAMSLGLTSEVSPLSTQLGEDAKNLMAQLAAASDAEFDALYLRSQVDSHMKVLMLIGEHLLPSVMADELRAELMLVRMEVATHLEGARNASTALEDTDAGTP